MQSSRTTHVFISHFTPEREIAAHIQGYLQEVFGPHLHVFRSSDDHSIPTGSPQYQTILKALEEAKVLVVLLSEVSTTRPWVCFETGYGVSSRMELVLWLVRGTTPGQLLSPFAEMQARPMSSSEVNRLVDIIERATGLQPSRQDPTELLNRVKIAEREVPQLKFDLEPRLVRDSLRFCLRYEGYTAVDLISVTIGIPNEAIQRSAWMARAGNNSFIQERAVRIGRQPNYLYRTYTNPPSVLPRDAGYAPLKPVVYPPNDEVDLSILRCPVNVDAISAHPDWQIQWEVETKRELFRGTPILISTVLPRSS